MKIAVTGATGVIGTRFVQVALARGHEIVALGRTAPEVSSPGFSWGSLDLAGRPCCAPESLQGCEVLVHLAAAVHVKPVDEAQKTEIWTTNVLGTGELIKAMSDGGVPRLILASTANVYDPRFAVADENTTIRPSRRALYLGSKVAQEFHALECCADAAIDLAIMRISSVVGTGQDLVQTLVDRISCGRAVGIDNPEYGCDFVSVDDVAEGLLIACEKQLTGLFNLSSGIRTTLQDLADRTAEALGRSLSLRQDQSDAEADIGFPAADCSKLADYGYNPRPIDHVIAEAAARVAATTEKRVSAAQ